VKPLAVDRAVALRRVVLALSRTWRFRDARDPDRPPPPPPEPVIFAWWHEFVLPFALFGGRWGVAGLTSRGRDGETSRGGGQEFRELARAVEAGRSVFITPDGPRVPRGLCQAGVIRLASVTGVPIVPLGLAAVTAHRLHTWDRFLIPAPGSRIFIFRGAEIHVPRDPDDESALAMTVGCAINRAVSRSETVREEARWRRPYRVGADRIRSDRVGGGRASRQPGMLARRVEPGLRRAWGRSPPSIPLRLASGAFAVARATRNGLYESGVIATIQAPLPIISVGGVTVGGSGKTPLASLIGRWLAEDGHRVAILTRGYPDEVRLHRALLPVGDVWGHPDRVALGHRAAAAGASVAVLDDGFQHRRLARDFDILALDRDALRRTNGASLPAGPFRERPFAAARRADAVVLVGREPLDGELARLERSWAERLGPEKLVARLSIESGPPECLRRGPLPGSAGPTVALTGIMKPNLFFELARSHCSTIVREHALPDHGLPGPEWPDLLESAADGGLLMTRKDYMRLASFVPEKTPIWVLPEHLVWRSGASELRDALLRAARREASGSGRS